MQTIGRIGDNYHHLEEVDFINGSDNLQPKYNDINQVPSVDPGACVLADGKAVTINTLNGSKTHTSIADLFRWQRLPKDDHPPRASAELGHPPRPPKPPKPPHPKPKPSRPLIPKPASPLTHPRPQPRLYPHPQ